MSKTAAERMADTRRRRAEEGIVQVQVYVHETRVEELRVLAAQMQLAAERTPNLSHVRGQVHKTRISEAINALANMKAPRAFDER
jgi:hypothetical protein